MKEGTALQHGDVFLAGIDQFRIFFTRCRWRTKGQQAVFRVQEYILVFWQVTGNPGRQANTQVDIGTIRNILGNPGCNLVTGQFDIAHHILLGGLCVGIRARWRDRHNMLDKDSRGHDMFRIQCTQLYHLGDLGNGDLGCHGHNRTEIACRFTVD